jgi:hypothetical protein
VQAPNVEGEQLVRESTSRLPNLLKSVLVFSVPLLLCAGGLMIWSMNTDSGWISIGVVSMLTGFIGAALLLWALVWWLSIRVHK